MPTDDTTTPQRPDLFDRALGALDGLPGMVQAGPAQVQHVTPLIGAVETFIIQTVRVPDVGEHVFVQLLSADRSFRLVIPPKVAAVIARQRDAISAKLRSRQAKRIAAERKAAGIAPGFLKNPHRGRRRAKARRAK